MPLYQYLCGECKLRFESVGGASNASQPAACPRCSRPAPRALPGSLRTAYSAQVSGIAPQNTGLSGVDTSYDRVIGQSARQGWDAQRLRLRDKHEILRRNPGASGEDLKRVPGRNVYEVMPVPERAMRRAAEPVAQVGREVVRGNPRSDQ
jgi:putative FmdB family regulatory protein